MSPNDRWDDFAIDNFVSTVKDFMTATSTLPNQIGKLSTAVENNTKRLDSHHSWIEMIERRQREEMGEMRDLIERVGGDLRADMKSRAESREEQALAQRALRNQVMVAIIGAGGVIAAAIIAAH